MDTIRIYNKDFKPIFYLCGVAIYSEEAALYKLRELCSNLRNSDRFLKELEANYERVFK